MIYHTWRRIRICMENWKLNTELGVVYLNKKKKEKYQLACSLNINCSIVIRHAQYIFCGVFFKLVQQSILTRHKVFSLKLLYCIVIRKRKCFFFVFFLSFFL